MRKFLYGLVLGTGLGYVFHENIDQALRTAVDKANEKVAETDGEYVGKVEYRGMRQPPETVDVVLPTERWRELNGATPDHPIKVYPEDIAAMGPARVQTGLDSGAFKLAEDMP